MTMLGTAIAALVASLTISEGDEWGRPLRALNLEGSDAGLPEVRPLSVEGGVATFRVDTHEQGNTTFYEIRDDREMRDGKTN